MTFSKAIIFVFTTLILLLVTLTIGYGYAKEKPTDSSQQPLDSSQQSNASPSEVMAELSDEQVRKMLMEELQSKANPSPNMPQKIKGPGSFFNKSLTVLSNEHEYAKIQLSKLLTGLPNVDDDFLSVFISLCPYGTTHGALQNTLWVLFFLSIGIFSEFLSRRFLFSKYFPPTLEENEKKATITQKLTAILIQQMPRFIGLVIFFATSYFSFMLFIWTDSTNVQLFFLAALLAITFIRITTLLSNVVLSPSLRAFRIIPTECKVANIMHTAFVATSSYIILTLMVAVTLRQLGAADQTVRLLQLCSATFLLSTTAVFILIYRTPIKTILLAKSNSTCQTTAWSRQQFASIWHILAILYLALLWFLLINDLADASHRRSGAFIPSFFIVPIWMIADRLIQWIVLSATKTLQIHSEEYNDRVPPSLEELLQRQSGRELYNKIKTIARSIIAISIAIWLAALWDKEIPLLSIAAGATFDALIIVTLAIFCWQLISSWIERKIQESLPDDDEENQEDDEWGGAASRGRAYTLLPMVKKFVGTVLVVMVTMTILSSTGVDIGPLLAGAGVIGLAIGFGAQKLVADVFSGFFYLLDDAFRVGEYIEAGAISGSVETITLRNAMIRHHRGMLQIVPHSDLGAITNYMRGGIIVKFSLDFPYDAPIDKIRKIIKKVGRQMLEDEEYGKDFIRPVKSQGVREITNSVMTIRVKFTAQPGTHFVIRREAYRLITEALNTQNIYYAHKKVIVDLPEVVQGNELDSETKEKISQAAGAAALQATEEGKKIG